MKRLSRSDGSVNTNPKPTTTPEKQGFDLPAWSKRVLGLLTTTTLGLALSGCSIGYSPGDDYTKNQYSTANNDSADDNALEISYLGGNITAAFNEYVKDVVEKGYAVSDVPPSVVNQGFGLSSGYGQTSQPLCASDDPSCVTDKDLPSSDILNQMNQAQCFHSTRLGVPAFESSWERTRFGEWRGQSNRSMISVGTYATLCFLSSKTSSQARIEAVGMGVVTVKSSKISRPRLDLTALGWGKVGW